MHHLLIFEIRSFKLAVVGLFESDLLIVNFLSAETGRSCCN